MKQAVILAGGEGQRLRPFTVTRPKAMLYLGGKPILAHVVEALARNGIRDIIVVAGYKREQVFDYLGSGEQFGVKITYVTQEKQLGSAHALAQAQGATEAEFMVLSGDNLIEPETIAEFIKVNPDAVLVKRVENPVGYGVVSVDGGLIRSVEEKPRVAASNIVNTGIYAFTKQVFDFIEPDLGIPDVLNSLIAKGHAIKAVETDSTWLNVVYPWDILSVNSAVLEHVQASVGGTIEAGVSLKGQVSVGKDTIIRSNSYIMGPVVIGVRCEIGPNVCIMPATTVGNNVVISPFTTVRNAVIGADVNIGPGSIVQGSVIDDGCTITGHFTTCVGQSQIMVDGDCHAVNVGAMLGAGCSLGSGVVAQPGVILGNYSQVQSLKLISGRLPDRSLVF